VVELERADELTEPLGVCHVRVLPEISDEEMKELQAEALDLGPVVKWMRDGRCPTNEYLKSKSQDTKSCGPKSPLFIYLMAFL